jgi:long-chain fatty acid transport protein
MKFGRRPYLCAAISFCMLLSPGSAESAGPIHGAKAAGMGTAFVAAGNDPSALAANPAGLTRSAGTQVYGGFTALTLGTRYISPDGDREKTEFQMFFPPNLFITSDLGRQKVVFGLGLYSPFGIGGRKWDEAGLTRYVSTESSIATINIHPTVAWQALPALSVGAGVYYLYALNRAERMVDQSPLGAADGKMVIEAEGDGWGYNFGLLWEASEQVSLGVAYRSGSKVDFTGTTTLSNIAAPLQPLFGGASFASRTRVGMTFPEIISLGLALKPSSRLTIGADGELVRWSSLRRSSIRFSSQVPEAGLVDGTSDNGWKDIWQLKAGLDYRLSDSLSVRTGYAYIDTQVPEHTLGPDSPEATQHNLCFGAGYRKAGMVFDVFYILGLVENRTVNNGILSGTYKNQNHYAGVNFGKKF